MTQVTIDRESARTLLAKRLREIREAAPDCPDNYQPMNPCLVLDTSTGIVDIQSGLYTLHDDESTLADLQFDDHIAQWLESVEVRETADTLLDDWVETLGEWRDAGGIA
jgi:hypothetical protein